jgi:hypothetical protein
MANDLGNGLKKKQIRYAEMTNRQQQDTKTICRPEKNEQ